MKKNIVISAPLYSLSGYGAHARDIVQSLWDSKKFNIVGVANGWGSTSSSQVISAKMKDILDFCTINKLREGQEFTYIHLGLPSEFKKIPKAQRTIGITAGLETDKIPKDWVEACNKIDLIIVPSYFEKDVFTKCGVTTHVEVVHEGVDIGVFNPLKHSYSPDLQKITTKFNFLTVGQWMNYNTGMDRKQIGLLIEIFSHVFKDRDDVGLVLKTHTLNNSTPDRYFTQQRIEELKEEINSKANIYLLHGELTDNEMSSLYTSDKINLFISLTSGEGWGRPVAEAIACDLPVMVTGWSGHMDFMKLSTPIPFKLSPVPSLGLPWFQRGMRWAYVNVEETINMMKDCVDNYDKYKTIAKEEGERFRRDFNKEITYEKLIKLLDT